MKYYRDNERHLIENYEAAKADNFKGWDIHHRLELTLNGEYAHTRAELKRLGMYYNRPYFELIYMKHADHRRLHALCSSEETHKKLSLAQHRRVITAEHRMNMSIAAKNRPKEVYERMAAAHRGKKLSEETRRKMSISARNRRRNNTNEHS